MNFREQLSEAYKAGFKQGLQELYAGAHEGADEEDEGYHEGMHEGEHEEQLDVVPLFSRDFRGTPIDPNVQAPIGFSRRRDPGSGRR